ncbi:UDP-3-O-(3-hydroxymyristoyl)glucosamine N-acyltransferase [Phenylobacterium immobile]|uniref:UDP-3-O-(3-hydroxymyristoyl)glucosamine N-acyltransferase n=1 Tax=Phenylobacterium immobile TaxID=21 RepID=UPI000AA97079|nr:UDP-3-O-(3-hydroxymyristoyl)glucosamine N-acyltransferase [Phenylobacterium immobile]
MPDPRFYESLGPISLGEIASQTGARLATPNAAARAIDKVAVLARADARSVSFLTDRRQVAELASAESAACFVTEANAEFLPADCVALITPTPQAAYAALAGRLHRLRNFQAGPALSPDAILEDGVDLAPGAVVGPGVRIGRGTRIGPNAVIGPGVTIGRDGLIGANVVLSCCLLGDRVQVFAGAVIGEAGFGAAAGPAGLVDMPQLGRVIIQDGCTIGANSCIDRGAYDDTMIGENTKIDNLVQIAHNVRVGRNCVMAAHTGISGSVIIGDGVQFGGRAGIADHIVIGAGARVAAAAGVMHDIPAGETWGGAPAQPIRAWMRETAWLRRQSTRKDGAENA